MASSADSSLGRFVAAVSVAGFLAIAHSIAVLPTTPRVIEWALFGALAMIAGSFALKVPGVPAHVSVSDTFFITSALLFGPAPATAVTALDSFVISWRRRHPANRMLFNTANAALALWIASQAFFAVAGVPPLAQATDTPPAAIVVPLALLAALYFAIHSGLTATAVALERGQRAVDLWRQHFAILSVSYFAAASTSFFLIIVVRFVNVMALAAVLPLLAIFYLAMRSWLGRLDDAQRHVAKMDRLYLSTIEALSTAIEAKDGVTSSHIHRVQSYALGLARALGVNDDETMKAIQAAALLHDTGKLAVPERILNKPGKLTAAEFETMKLHVDVGADILSSIDFPYPVVPIVRCHHENWDGSGYPRGVKGEEIPIGARILSVVDCFDALTSDRPYRPAMTDEQAIAIILERRGTMYDPEVVDTFVRVHRSIAPAAGPQPELAEAIRHISRSVAPEAPRVTTLVASCVLFGVTPRGDRIEVRFASGEDAAALEGLSMGVGERLSGWVAANRQVIVNSDARLDFGADLPASEHRYCLSVPLAAGESVNGVLTFYAPAPFAEEYAGLVQAMAPGLAQMLARAAAGEDRREESRSRPSRSDLRLVSR